MFDYSLAHWAAFLATAILLNLSPGPDIAYILGQTARHGINGGFRAMFGVWTGALIHVCMAALGLSAILATSAIAFSVVKWAGAAYLIYLGVKAIMSRGGSFAAADKSAKSAGDSIYWPGVMVSVLNPKVAVFFLAFLPQFVEPGAGPVSAQLFLHGFLIIVVAALIEPPLVLAGSRLLRVVRTKPQIGLWMDRGLGALFISMGLSLAFSERR